LKTHIPAWTKKANIQPYFIYWGGMSAVIYRRKSADVQYNEK
jgi:hypothetical protein